MTSNDWTIDTIIAACGGPARIAGAVNKGPSAIVKWRGNGIPDRHWAALFVLARNAFGPDDVFRANQALRGAGDDGEAA